MSHFSLESHYFTGQHEDTVTYIYLQSAAADDSPALISCQFLDGGTEEEKKKPQGNETSGF